MNRQQLFKRWVAVGILALAATLCFAGPGMGSAAPIQMAVGWLLVAACVAIALSGWDTPASALIRLDWFLPMIRRPKQGQATHHRLVGRLLRGVVPQRWLSDYETKRRGSLRRALRWLGISWLASPPRRAVQSICLVAFLFSFFYVCWPYGARPVPPGKASGDWRFSEIDQLTGELRFTKRSDTAAWIQQADQIYLQRDTDGSAYALDVRSTSDQTVTLGASEGLPDALLDELLTGGSLGGPAAWTLHETDPGAWPTHYADNLDSKEILAAELFLVIDPLVSLSTAIASRSWVWSLTSAAVILIVCILVPRGFCGYVCPLGTTIDLFDWAITSRTDAFRVSADGWWVHIKYYLLAGTLLTAVCGVLLSGFVSAIPVITRAMLFIGEPLQSGMLRGWHQVPPLTWGHVVSIALFFAVLGFGFLRPRFWCKYVCPSGAVFSVGNLFRATERKVESSCIHCNKCVEICPFDAIKPDFTTRGTDCTMCQSCGGVCPTHAIKFVERWNVVQLKAEDDPPTGETSIGRRGLMSLAAGTAAAAVGGVGIAGVTKLFGAQLDTDESWLPVRPPGSVPEQAFLQMCIRCGECFKACPNNVLQPEFLEQGLEGMWTPIVNADWAGCESSCNACGQVCPTGAIRALPMEEKRFARMGLAIVNQQTCLPIAGREACDLCVQECDAAGYHAIEYMQVGTEVDADGVPVEGSGMLAPVVLEEKCVGCGLCQTRCHGINVRQRGVLTRSAVIIEAGQGREDRLMEGSYVELRARSQASPTPRVPIAPAGAAETTIPDDAADQANPFGL